jgi:four helix bundle protein
MNKEELRQRTKELGLRAIKLVRALPKDVPGKTIANQLMRSAMSVGANYRSACRGRSKAEWLSKLGICLEEADESAFWLELIMEDGMLSRRQVEPLWNEAHELCAIFHAALQTGRNPSA